MSLMIAGAVYSLALAASVVEVHGGADLIEALGVASGPEVRFGLDGAPPGARGARPVAPAAAGDHYLIEYDADGAVIRRVRFSVAGDATSPPALSLPIDREPPRFSVQANPAVDRDGRRFVGPGTVFAIDASDASGLTDAPTLWLNGAMQTSPDRPDWPTDDGPLRIEARAGDALGNAGSSEQPGYVVDRTPPTLGASRAKPRDGVPLDVVAADDTIILELRDEGAGLGSLTIGGETIALDAASTQTLRHTLSSADTAYVLSDRLGNAARSILPLRMDDGPPRLVFVADGIAQQVEHGAQLPRSEQLDLQAVDEPAGVARACVGLSIWYDECRPLPLSLLGIGPGRYSLTFRALDHLGQRAFQRYEIEVLP